MNPSFGARWIRRLALAAAFALTLGSCASSGTYVAQPLWPVSPSPAKLFPGLDPPQRIGKPWYTELLQEPPPQPPTRPRCRPIDLNEDGLVVGQVTLTYPAGLMSNDEVQVFRAFVFRDGESKLLPVGSRWTLPPLPSSAFAINDAGEALGYVLPNYYTDTDRFERRYFRWEEGSLAFFDEEEDGSSLTPTCINNHGHIAGILDSGDESIGFQGLQTFIRVDDGIETLPPVQLGEDLSALFLPHSLLDDGTVLGTVLAFVTPTGAGLWTNQGRIVLWQGDAYEVLGDELVWPTAINEQKQVLLTIDLDGETEPALWSDGALINLSSGFSSWESHHDLNRYAQIVGASESGFAVFRNDPYSSSEKALMFELFNAEQFESLWLDAARRINDSGQILCTGREGSGPPTGYLLTPKWLL